MKFPMRLRKYPQWTRVSRFSEDMDFSLLITDKGFAFENYFQPIIDEFDSLGRKVEIKKKDKRVLAVCLYQTHEAVTRMCKPT